MNTFLKGPSVPSLILFESKPLTAFAPGVSDGLLVLAQIIALKKTPQEARKDKPVRMCVLPAIVVTVMVVL